VCDAGLLDEGGESVNGDEDLAKGAWLGVAMILSTLIVGFLLGMGFCYWAR
jgi:hypothetical protein